MRPLRSQCWRAEVEGRSGLLIASRPSMFEGCCWHLLLITAGGNGSNVSSVLHSSSDGWVASSAVHHWSADSALQTQLSDLKPTMCCVSLDGRAASRNSGGGENISRHSVSPRGSVTIAGSACLRPQGRHGHMHSTLHLLPPCWMTPSV